jgi:hypothetical protein
VIHIYFPYDHYAFVCITYFSEADETKIRPIFMSHEINANIIIIQIHVEVLRICREVRVCGKDIKCMKKLRSESIRIMFAIIHFRIGYLSICCFVCV